MKSYHIPLLLSGEQTRSGLVPKLACQAEQIFSALEKELPSFTGVLTFVLHFPNPRNKQFPSLSL